MSTWKRLLRFFLTVNLLFLLVLGFSYWQIDPSTEAGRGTLVVIVLALIPTVLTTTGVLAVTWIDWDPF